MGWEVPVRPIDASLIRVPLRCHNKDEAIAELLDLLAAQGLIRQRDEVYRQLLDREHKKSTAIGYGAAIPHVRTEHVDDTLCAFGSAPEGSIDFANVGEAPQGAQLLFLMVSPKEDAPAHLRTLAMIARLIKDDRRRDSLKSATQTETILELLGELARS